MDILLHNVQQAQLPLIQELAKALGFSIEDENTRQIKAAIERVESGTAELRTLDWEAFRKLAYGE